MRHTVFFILFVFFYQINAFSSNQYNPEFQDIIDENNTNFTQTVLSEIDCSNDISEYKIQDFKKANKASKGLNTFSGLVYMGINLLPKGTIYLIENKKGNFVTSRISEILDGLFTCEELMSGNYTLYVIPKCKFDFFYFPKYLPTYYGNSYSWEESVVKNIQTDLSGFTIHLTSYPFPFYGHESISGQIKYRSEFRGDKEVPITVILLNQSKKPMDFRITNPFSGEFEFKHLPPGTYYLHPEVPGIKSEDLKVTVESNNNFNNDIKFFINNDIVKAEVNNDKIKNVTDGKYLKLFLDENIDFPVVCELINMSGCSIKKNIYYSNEIYINTTGMSAGIYILRVKTYDNSLVKTQKVYINNYF